MVHFRMNSSPEELFFLFRNGKGKAPRDELGLKRLENLIEEATLMKAMPRNLV